MKTLLVVSKANLKKHAGREVDDYVEVKTIPTPEEMPAIANEIRNRIRALAIEADKKGELEREVTIEFDASPPYRVILIELAEAMAESEKMKINLPPDFVKQEREDVSQE
jgi:hypothetical protein